MDEKIDESFDDKDTVNKVTTLKPDIKIKKKKLLDETVNITEHIKEIHYYGDKKKVKKYKTHKKTHKIKKI
jgi:hypothetical protein